MSTDMLVNGLTFDGTVREGLACIQVRRGAFALGTDLEEKQRLFALLADLEVNDDIRAVLIFNDVDAFSGDEHRRFAGSLTQLQEIDHGEQAKTLLAREDNAFNQYLLQAMRYEKLIVSCLCGEIASPFLGLSLASDARLCDGETQFRLSHVDLGVPPIGGLGYLLPKYVGQGLAAEWLLSGGTIDADTSLRSGLVNAVLHTETFKTECIAWTQHALSKGTAHIKATRRLLYRETDAFGAYMREELKFRDRALVEGRE